VKVQHPTATLIIVGRSYYHLACDEVVDALITDLINNILLVIGFGCLPKQFVHDKLEQLNF